MSGERSPSRLVWCGIEGPALDPSARERLTRLRPGGVVLFAHNVGGLEPLAALVSDLKRLDPELVVAIDQEGGPVDRLRPHLPGLPAAAALGAAGDSISARRHGELLGESLALLGIDWDLAPVLDLALSEEDNAIGLRSFGSDPERVATLGRAVLEGIESQGVLGCLKHFPGLGQARADSHLTLPVIAAPREELLAADVVPFDEVRPAASAILVGHGYYPHLTLKGAFPATLSSEVTTGLLKQGLGFGGAAVTDDLVMGAVATDAIGRAAVRAVEAGADVLLVCAHDDRPFEVARALEQAASRGLLAATRLDDAFGRVGRLRARLQHLRRRAGLPLLPRPEPQRFAALAASMRELAEEIASQSVTLDRRGATHAPLRGPLIVLRPRLKWLSEECSRVEGSPFQVALGEAGLAGREVAYDSEHALEQLAQEFMAEPPPAAWFLATSDAHRRPGLAELAVRLAERAPVHHLALGRPRDLEHAPLAASVSTRGAGWHAVVAGMRLLLGLRAPGARRVA